MQKTEIVLDILNKRSIHNLPINDIYRCFFNNEWYILSYSQLTKSDILPNHIKYINEMIELIKYEKYQWNKNQNNDLNFRKLNKHDLQDKILLNLLYIMLSNIYEPRFLECSHGYRLNKGCNTALTRIRQKGRGCEWFININIENNIDKINHSILLNILSETIKDGRFIELIRKMLKANKINEFVYNRTYSGIPINDNLSSLLYNIYLDKFDKYIENNIVPLYNKGNKRNRSYEYSKISNKITRNWKKYNDNNDKNILTSIKKMKKIRRHMNTYESIENDDFRRLTYTRYGNECLITFTGTYEEANNIVNNINEWIYNNLILTTNYKIVKSTNPIKFLNYNIIVQKSNNMIIDGRRCINGEITFLIPNNVINEFKKKYTKNGKGYHISYRIHETDFDIILLYQMELKGIIQYYQFARNQYKLNTLKWFMETSLLKTLAAKHKTHISNIRKKYNGTKIVDNFSYKIIQVCIKNKVAYFGAIPLKRKIPFDNVIINDIIPNTITIKNKTSIINNLLDKKCEICGSTENLQMHHIHKLKDINNKLDWFKRKISLERKVICLCKNCHNDIHKGKYNKRKLR